MTACTRHHYRAILPRQTDLVSDVLNLLADAKSAEEILVFVLDAVDAYWQVPLDPREKRFYCAKVWLENRFVYVVYERTAQGSRGAPLSWTALFGLVCRLVFSTIRCSSGSSDACMEVYVDDPIMALRGTEEVARHHAALAILGWSVLGVPLAFKKGQFGQTAEWIGAQFKCENVGVMATITAARLQELRELTVKLLASNVVSLPILRTYTGKAQSMASLLYTWRPFVHMLYGAMSVGAPGDAPSNCIWTKQVLVPLLWLRAFLQQQHGNLRRHWNVDSYFNRGPRIQITTDASPWGVGAVLEVDGQTCTWLSDAISAHDRPGLSLGVRQGRGLARTDTIKG